MQQIAHLQEPDQPPELQTAAQRAHELLLFEAHNTLARLLQDESKRSRPSGLDSMSARWHTCSLPYTQRSLIHG